MVESSSDEILADADTKDIAFCVVGDPFSATTHTDLALRCRQHDPPIKTRTLPNASILTAVGATGLSLYAFGQTISMVFFTDTWKPDSFYGRVKDNNGLGLHTLVLLDIKVKEPNLEALARGSHEPRRLVHDPAAQCAQQMVEIEELRKEDVCGKDKLAVSVARLGSDGEKIVAGTLEELGSVDMGAPLHSLVLCGTNMHEMEWEYIREFAVNRDKFDEIWKRDYAGKN
jgi:diphthine synthase